MQLSLLKEQECLTSVLPEKVTGQYWITHHNEDGVEERVVSVEGIDGAWFLKSGKHVWLLDSNGQKVKETKLIPNSFYQLVLKKTEEKAWLYSEPVSEDRKQYRKFILPEQAKLIIGRAQPCDIRFDNKFVSSMHAEISVYQEEWVIRDLDSSNGTFVNGARVKQASLTPGDIVSILGLKIVIGRGFIALNNPDGQVTYNRDLLSPYTKQQPIQDEEEQDDEEISVTSTFYRSPRFMRNITSAEIKIDPPPPLGNTEQTPLMLMLGPSLTMGMAALFMGFFTLQNVLNSGGSIMQAMPTLMMSTSMVAGTVLWPILTRRYEAKKRREKEQLRKQKYMQYLAEIQERIANESMHQSQILHENHTAIDSCVNRIRLRQRNLWERTHGQIDFLKIRLGLGNLPLDAKVEFPEKRFTLEDDQLQDELHKLAEAPKVLEQVPITISLLDDWVTGVIGRRSNVIRSVKSMILQLVSLHSYDEIKLVFIYDQSEQETWDFVRWLPHVWSQDNAVRYIATNMNEVKELSAYLEKEIARREHEDRDDARDAGPHYIIFAMNKNLVSKSEAISNIYKSKENIGFSVVHLYDDLVSLPKECSMVVEFSSTVSKIYDKDDISGQHIAFQPDVYTAGDERDLAVSLANLKLDSSNNHFTLPTMLTFLDMFEVGKIEHLNALTRWKENDPTITLETPIGVNTNGELFKLDLHEKFHGPHGLIAGMTGSGKSEFIMTYILSLAVNYHPHEVAFILIDYKGGGMANAFLNLPHLAGTITNLDGAAVNRSLVSIQSELKRRQAIFSETSKKVNISNIDIYKYQKLYREGQVDEPLQHLFIISDEFAELKTQQPEFMEQLVSAARIGRSLGVHLILATQKPSGVVDDQIWSNSKFRICLKVQEKADSMDVIKRPDAAELSVTGRYYVQVGFNELFELGQSAWGGAPYYPSDRVEQHKDESISVIDNLGRIVKQVRLDRRQAVHNPPKQIDEIGKYLETIAAEEGIKVKPLWLEPISPMILLDELREKYAVSEAEKFVINPVIGEIDDPANQRQMIMTFPLTREGNAVIYGAAGAGKTTFLTSLIYSIMQEHTPAEVNMYILDFGSETLRSYAKAPHVGDVLLSHETEKTTNLIKMLYKEIETRKRLFADYGGDHRTYIRSTGQEIPSIIVMIHNYSAFAETYDGMEEDISYLTREGVKYGIYFILTAANTGAVRYRILQNFKQLYVLQLNDPSDYSGVLGNVDGVYPSKYKGRGIFKSDGVFEFQTAHIDRDVDATLDLIRNYCEDYARQWDQVSAKKIPVLPEIVDIHHLEDEIRFSKPGEIPFGVEKNSLQIAKLSYGRRYIHPVWTHSSNSHLFMQGLAEALASKGETTVVVIDPQNSFASDEERLYQYLAMGTDYDAEIEQMFNTLVTRNNTYKDALEQGKQPPQFEPITYIIESFHSLLSVISEDSKGKLFLLLEKGSADYQVQFIIADRISDFSTHSFEPWFKEHVSLSDGIWVGNGITDQYQLKLSKITNDLYEEIGEAFGYKIAGGKTVLVKLLTSVTDQVEVELVG